MFILSKALIAILLWGAAGLAIECGGVVYRKFLLGDVYQHLISSLSLLISFAALVGGFVLSMEFRKRKRDARYGYYVNLETMLSRLRGAICVAEEKPNYALYRKMSNNPNHQEEIKGPQPEQVKKHAVRILNYFSEKSNIVPAGRNTAERIKWKQAITTVRVNVAEFEKYNAGDIISDFSDEEIVNGQERKKVDIFHENLIQAIKEISRIIKVENERRP